MRPILQVVLAALLMGIVLTPAAALAQRNEPTLETAQAAYDAGDYRGAATMLNKLAAAKGRAKESIDQYRLYMLKGSTELQLNQRPQALRSFETAAKEGIEPEEKREALAMVALLKRTKKPQGYSPKADPTRTIDIVNPESRKEAFAAALDDARAELDAALDKAQKGKSNESKLIDLFPLFGELMALEYGATGGTDSIASKFQPIAEQVTVTIQKDIDRASTAAEKLNKLAREMKVRETDDGDTEGGFRGLRGGERRDAQAVGKEITRIGKLALQAEQAANQWALPIEGLGDMVNQCQNMIEELETSLKIVPGQDSL
jgi:hypothetical protein